MGRMRSTFGPELRQWRTLRGMSQMELATRADVSQRHISFLETGRSRPSREMVMHLGRTLDVPPREQNLLLSAAGHAPAIRGSWLLPRGTTACGGLSHSHPVTFIRRA